MTSPARSFWRSRPCSTSPSTRAASPSPPRRWRRGTGWRPRHLETLLQELVRARILKGTRGPRGGYELARERRRISVGRDPARRGGGARSDGSGGQKPIAARRHGGDPDHRGRAARFPCGPGCASASRTWSGRLNRQAIVAAGSRPRRFRHLMFDRRRRQPDRAVPTGQSSGASRARWAPVCGAGGGRCRRWGRRRHARLCATAAVVSAAGFGASRPLCLGCAADRC